MKMVGMVGFDPTTSCPPDKCATGLRYIPMSRAIVFDTRGLRMGHNWHCTESGGNR